MARYRYSWSNQVSTDFSPIENNFNHVKRELYTQAFENNMNYETFEQFSLRVKYTLENALENTSTKYIDQTIESMPKRMLIVIKQKGGV